MHVHKQLPETHSIIHPIYISVVYQINKLSIFTVTEKYTCLIEIKSEIKYLNWWWFVRRMFPSKMLVIGKCSFELANDCAFIGIVLQNFNIRLIETIIADHFYHICVIFSIEILIEFILNHMYMKLICLMNSIYLKIMKLKH